MRIISKWTDYYDHEVAHFGYDETRVYDRRNLAKPYPFNNQFLFHICGKIYPAVAKYGFPSILDSRTMYGMIYDYLGWLKDNPPPPDNQTDKQKVVSHGFDPKRSFRPKMKKV